MAKDAFVKAMEHCRLSALECDLCYLTFRDLARDL